MPSFGLVVLLGLLASATAQATLELYLEKTRYDVNEDDGSVTVRVIASEPVPQITILTIQLSDDSAVSGMDYLQSGSLSTVLLTGATQVDFTFTILNDEIPEMQDEKFNVALLARDNYELGQPREAAVYIKDDDGLVLSLKQDRYNISEGDGSVTVCVVSSRPATDDTTVFLLVSDGSAVNGTDYLLDGTMVIVMQPNGIQLTGVLPKGESEAEFTIKIIDDNTPETEEEFNVTLIAGNYAVGEMSAARVYIQDNDDAPVLPPGDPEPVSSLNLDDSATITWDVVGGLTYQCSLDDGPPVACQPGYTVPEEKLPLANHLVTVTAFQGGEEVGSGEVIIQTCKLTGISPLRRKYLWPSGFVRFKWDIEGNVASTGCKVDGGQEVDCESGMKYDLYQITAGKHVVEVIAYCSASGERISSERKKFNSQSGIPSDPDNCERMSVENSLAVYDSTAATVTITFDTSTESTCVCKLSGIGQTETGCESGYVFTGAKFTGKKLRGKVSLVCTSADCGVKHMVPVYFNL